MVKFSDGKRGLTADHLQRVAEGQNLDIRLFLRKYEAVIEGQRLTMRERRQAVLDRAPDPPDAASLVSS